MLNSCMFSGGSFRCSPVSADYCPPDGSACAGMVGSHGVRPKLSPLFRSEDHTKRALKFQFSDFGDQGAFCTKPRKIRASTKRSRNSRRICTSIFIGFETNQNQLTKNADPARIGVPSSGESPHLSPANKVEPERGISPELSRFCEAGLSRLVPSFEGVSRGLQAAPFGFRVPHFLRFVQQVGIRSARSLSPLRDVLQGQQNEHLRKNGRGVGRRPARTIGHEARFHWSARDATAGRAKASYDSRKPMRSLTARAVFYLLLIVGAIGGTGAAALAPSVSAFAPSASAFAKDKPLAFKSIENALLRVNDAPPKEWEVYRTGKKNEPLLLQIGNRFLLLQISQHQVFELDSSKIEHKTGELLWSPSDRPDKPLATSDWTVDDIGAAFIVKVRLQSENALVDLQLPHPPNVGNLPDRPPAQ